MTQPPFYDNREEYAMAQTEQQRLICQISEEIVALKDGQIAMGKDVVVIKTVLLGVPQTTNGGLVKWVEKLERREQRNSRFIWMLTGMGVLLGSGFVLMVLNVFGG